MCFFVVFAILILLEAKTNGLPSPSSLGGKYLRAGAIGNSQMPLFSIGLSLGKSKDKTCCESIPQVCSADGRCTLGLTVCAKLCLCVSGPRGSWCEEIFKDLKNQAERNRTLHEQSTTKTPNDIVTPLTNVQSTPSLPPTRKLQTESIISPSSTVGTERSTSNVSKEVVITSPTGQQGLITKNSDSPFFENNSQVSEQTAADNIDGGYKTDSTFNLDTSTPALTLSPSALSVKSGTGSDQVTLQNATYIEEFIEPSYRMETASTVFNARNKKRLMKSADRGSSGKVSSDYSVNHTLPLVSSTSSHFINETSHSSYSTDVPNKSVDQKDNPSFERSNNDDIETTDYPPFIPPVIGSSCKNCNGTCRLLPNFQLICDTKNPSKCESFGCRNNGTCVEIDGHVQCICDRNHTGIFCEHLCNLDCSSNGRCAYLNKAMKCICDWNHTGQFCLELKTTPSPVTKAVFDQGDTLPWHIIGICLGLLVFLVIVFVLLPYWTWRRRWLPIRKFVHYFQHSEDDDGKEYDAFISYKSTKEDEHFVVHKLYPKLEKELDFKLCLHFRDFPPGETIANNIIRAVENSRRTIMVLSPSYVESEWCRLEYQKAQHEMLKLKHKIIPIMLEDISGIEKVDKNLKEIINSVTYIDWPKDENTKTLNRFWKLLQCSMPKRKTNSSRSDTSGGSSSSDLPLTSVSASCFIDTLSDDVFPERSESVFSTGQGDLSNIEIKVQDISSQANGEIFSGELVLSPQSEPTKLFASNPPDIGGDDHMIQIKRLSGHKLKALRRYKWDIDECSRKTESFS